MGQNDDGHIQIVSLEKIPCPVLQCCASGMPAAAQALLNACAPIDGTDIYGRTALHYAYANHMHDVINELLANGADSSLKDEFGWPPSAGIKGPYPTPAPLQN